MEFSTKGYERRRHTFIDETVSITREMLAESAVQDALGESAASFNEILDQLYVPNITNYQLEVPEAYRHNQSIAITAVRHNEILVAKGIINELHKRQEDQFTAFIDTYNGNEGLTIAEKADAISHINRGLRQYEGAVTVPKKIAAQVMEADLPLTFYSKHKKRQTKKVVSGRPFIVLGMSGADTLPQRGLTSIHEIRHIDQTLRSTVLNKSRFDPDLALSSELEAYQTQAFVMRALYHKSTNKKFWNNTQIVNRLAADVEVIRQNANKGQRNPFAASYAVKAQLKQEKINIVV